MSLIRNNEGCYRTKRKTVATESEVLATAEDILRRRFERQATLSSPSDTRSFLRMRLAGLLHEEFHIVWLDNRHRIIAVEKLFTGTIDGSSIHPREVVRAALACNASGAVLAHNHPSGVAEPSISDRDITAELVRTLKLIGVRVLDHIVVGSDESISFAERGLL
jgi:DNA repair protein RadC